MKTSYLTIAVVTVALLVGTQSPAFAVTIPAGTTIVIKTTNNIISDSPRGYPFDGVLANNIAVGGKVVVPAGTPLYGSVKSPHFTIASSSRPLTLRLTNIILPGHPVAVKTEDLECGSNSPWTVGPDRRVQITGDSFTYYAGTFIPFRLKEPVEI